ncbi:hypothetical protein [Candidatus Phytoplasma sp. AldY-WA1]|uniref:hypothetical protein n=1 Tax=Candidatus Phytoplasma sp. AldY-WA1 TaxID=2852100 RepID=UPI00254F740B|nr:hypothetical protein [Candidatus Phytoplasma sp. AldY-WA1]
MNIKKIVILTIIFLLCILSIFIIIATTNYFFTEKQELIQFADLEECKREWLQTQRPLQRHDIYVMSKHEIPEYMKNFNIDVDTPYRPAYNSYNNESLIWYLKEPENGLLGIYFKPRYNPFKTIYPADDYEYTLDDLLKYELEISDAYVFWDANIKDDLNTTILHHKIEICKEQNNIIYKTNSIQKDLFDDNITNNKIRVNLNCYNLTSTAGLSASFNSNKSDFYGYKIEAVYFDDGYRLEYPDISIDNLIRLGNGAKTIHLYSFVVIDKLDLYKNDECDDPYIAIREWKKANNLFNNPQVIAKSGYAWQIRGEKFILTHTVETEKEIYHIAFTSNYTKELQKWKDQCYIKKDQFYTAQEIRNKLGRTNKIIYDECGNKKNYGYVEGFIFDDWYVDGKECIGSENRFDHYYDTTKPPKIPIKNNSLVTRETDPDAERFFTFHSHDLGITWPQKEVGDERIVRTAVSNLKAKKINKTVKIHKKL